MVLKPFPYASHPHAKKKKKSNLDTDYSSLSQKQTQNWLQGISWGPVVSPGSMPGQGTKIPKAVQYGKKKKKKITNLNTKHKIPRRWHRRKI